VSKQEIAAAVKTIRSLMNALNGATATDKAEIYAALNLHLTYNPGPRTVITRAGIGQTCTKGSCPRGDLNTETGEISLVRGNHAAKVTRTGPARTGILPGVRYLLRHLACAWPGGICRTAGWSPVGATHRRS
jgi:hypothetical protein